MSEVGIILGIVALVVVAAADTIVRLRIAPRRRNKFLEDLLESMSEPEPAERVAGKPRLQARSTATARVSAFASP